MPKTNTMTLRVSDELKSKLDRYAQLTGRSMSYVAATAVEEYLAWRVPQLEDLKQASRKPTRGSSPRTRKSAKSSRSMEVRWLRRALRDLDTIATHIARDNPKAARALVESIREKAERLVSFPYMGRASERADIRELVVHEHCLVSYRIGPGRIEVLQIWHTAQKRRG